MVNRSGVGPAFSRIRGLVLLVLLALGTGFMLWRDAEQPSSSGPRPLAPTQIRVSLARLPMSFEPNQGQADSGISFLAHGSGYGLYLTPSKAVLTLPQRSKKGFQQTELEMRLAGSNLQSEIVGAEPLPGHSNYFIGNDSSRWLRNIPQFGRVQYRGVYPGIDLAFYGNQNRLEYDFDVSPGADARQIELNFNGAKNISISNNGNLVLTLDDRELSFQAPHIYQKTSSGEQAVAGAFIVRSNNSVGFEIGAYDHNRSLVIDPILTFSTYLGGTGDESCTAIIGATAGFVPHCPSVAISSAQGAIYVAGATNTAVSAGFAGKTPVTIPTNTTPNPAMVFVSQISTTSSGSTLVFVTYIGGAGTQYPVGIGVDSGFNVYVAGTTTAANYPTTPSAFQTVPANPGQNHVFVSKLDPTGSLNLYSSYLSGNGVDVASNMTLDTQGRVYVIGTTTSSDFPTTLGAIQPHPNATNQFFFSKLNTALNTAESLRYSTYIGGSTPVSGATIGMMFGGAVAVDSNFNVYLAGGTNFSDMGSPNPWILNAFEAGPQGGIDVWAAKLNAPPANTEQYTVAFGTYFGGSGDDVAYGIATDGTSTYITGSTNSTNITIPSTTLAFQTCLDQAPPNTSPCPSGVTANDAFVAKFGVPAVSGTTQGTVPLDYFSYLGGAGLDTGLAIVADSLGNARVTGFTDSTSTTGSFPITPMTACSSTVTTNCNPLQVTSLGAAGGRDAFLARLNTTGTTSGTTSNLSGFLGGSGTDIGTSIALDPSLNMYLTGETSSPDFPPANPLSPSGGSLSGTTDAFVTVVGPNISGLSMPNPTPPNASTTPGCNAANPTVSPSPAGVGNSVKFTYYIFNIADPVAGVTFTDSPGVNSSQVSAAISGASGGTCSSTSSGPLFCSLGTVPSSSITSLSSNNVCGANTSVSQAASVTVTVTAPSAVQQGSSTLGNSAFLTFPGGSTASIFASVPLNDFSVSASLAPPSTSSTIPSGGQVDYSVQVTPTGAGFAEQVSLACGAGLPTGSTCTFTNNPIPTMANGPQSRTLAISTTARVTTTVGLFRRGAVYALWLPILGVGLMGAGFSRRRRMLLIILFAVVFALALLQVGCGGYHTPTTITTSGTPAGTYTIPVNATSGSAVRTTTVQFTVE